MHTPNMVGNIVPDRVHFVDPELWRALEHISLRSQLYYVRSHYRLGEQVDRFASKPVGGIVVDSSERFAERS